MLVQKLNCDILISKGISTEFSMIFLAILNEICVVVALKKMYQWDEFPRENPDKLPWRWKRWDCFVYRWKALPYGWVLQMRENLWKCYVRIAWRECEEWRNSMPIHMWLNFISLLASSIAIVFHTRAKKWELYSNPSNSVQVNFITLLLDFMSLSFYNGKIPTRKRKPCTTKLL